MKIKLGAIILFLITWHMSYAGSLSKAEVSHPGWFSYLVDGVDKIYKNFSKENTKIDLKNTENMLIIKNFCFNPININQNIVGISSHGADGEEVAVEGEALVYPNPFKQSRKSELSNKDENFQAVLYYKLTTAADIDVYIYNMEGFEMFRSRFSKGAVGGQEGDNNIYIDQLINGQRLSAGVYFFYLVSHDKVLRKGKMAVKPG